MDDCRVVLVRPQVPGNIGATARVMHNMGLTRLVLVQPVADPLDREARRLSTQGEFILHQALVVPDLESALADYVLVAGTSSAVGGPFRRQSAGRPDEIMPHLMTALGSGPVALVFGPEPAGLSNEEVTHCHYLITIPANPAYPSLNLAQSVAVCLYELRKTWLRRDEKSPPREIAPHAAQERLFAALRQALHEIHFLYDERADVLMHALRHLIGRAGPSPMEVDLLHGLARQMRWIAAQRQQEDKAT